MKFLDHICEQNLRKDVNKMPLSFLEKNQPVDRIKWPDLMLFLAYIVSSRSHDVQTQHGAIICNQDNEIIATGYNGFVRGIDDSILPNTRPNKYAIMIHAEENSILNCARQGKSTKGTTIYVTGMPCLHCLQCIWQAGIIKVIYGKQLSHMQKSEDAEEKSNMILSLTGLEIEHRIPNFSTTSNMTDKTRQILKFFEKI